MQDIFREFIVYARGCVLRNKKDAQITVFAFKIITVKAKQSKQTKAKPLFSLLRKTGCSQPTHGQMPK